MSVLVAVDPPIGPRVAEEIRAEGVEVAALVRTDELVGAVADPASRVWDALREADSVVAPATRQVLAPEVIAMCDRSGARLVMLAERPSERRAVAAFGLASPVSPDATGAQIVAAIRAEELDEPRHDAVAEGSVTVVWGPHGAPGRTTVALALAAARARGGDRVALVDADTHAPSVAQRLALPPEAPGFPAACRQTDYGVLDGAELTRLSAQVSAGDWALEVLTGINRPERWPELSARRVAEALQVARSWAGVVVVDVAAPVERDEEIVSDIEAPRRNQAALAALSAADRVIAVGQADPVGLARLVRGLDQLEAAAPRAEVIPVVNRVRPGPLGLDPRGQVREALAQHAGSDAVHLLPDDPAACDRALRAAAPVLPRRRAPLAHAVSRLAATL
ncbi:hypothetical protein [Microbacterium excoecariae]|uniref:nucleotide-binding protein n=1 Tax=Microbacterium excoecariae TaxID=2715210 RepID=UPI001407FC73|nr:hypothetical protein [Microbacterium excoecariae]